MKYRDLKPNELVEEGDECKIKGIWCPSGNWRRITKMQSSLFKYRRPIRQSKIQDRLQSLAVEMCGVALVMLEEDQSATMRSKGVELKDSAKVIYEWLESMKAEETIQGFVEGRKQ